MAQQADLHDLYQKAVQAPEAEVDFFTKCFLDIRGTPAKLLREDFCGTAYLAVAWCKNQPEHLALGVDCCAETLAWGRRHNIEPEDPHVVRRISLVHADVCDVSDPKVDITCAMNFSYSFFKTRHALRQYFTTAHAGLNRYGLLILDMFGGVDTYDAMEEEREVEDEDFTYIWEQESFNPITHGMVCHIHFLFPDGSRLDRAFTYQWRLWTIPEMRELLQEAGFRKVRVFWEEYRDDGDKDNEYLEGTGNYIEVQKVENQESWVSYLVAEV